MLHAEEIKLLQKSLRIHRKVADLVLCIESNSSVSPVLFQGLEDRLGRLGQDIDAKLLVTSQLNKAFELTAGGFSPSNTAQIRRHLSVAIATLEKMP